MNGLNFDMSMNVTKKKQEEIEEVYPPISREEDEARIKNLNPEDIKSDGEGFLSPEIIKDLCDDAEVKEE